MARQDHIALFAFANPDGICRIERIDLPDGRVVVICQELDENPGQSVTSAAAEIAGQWCRKHRVDPDKLVWIEHYAAGPDGKPEWELVRLDRGAGPITFISAERWKPMELDDWRDLGLPPRYKPSHSPPVT